MPFFSVIIPTYNRQFLLKLSVESVLSQTFKDFELIIIDDGSTDNTKHLIKRYNDSRLNYIYQENKGPSAARNTGIKNARGKFVCFLDSDDRFRKNKLKKTYGYIHKYPKHRIFHTEEIWYRNGKYLPQKRTHQKPTGYIFLNAIKICCVSLSTACIYKNVFRNIGMFDKQFPVCEDYEFWLRVTLKYPIKLIPEFLTIKEGGHIDQQSAKKGLDKYRVLALCKLLTQQKINTKHISFILKNIDDKSNIYFQGAKKRNKLTEAQIIKQKAKEIIKTYGT